MTGEMNVHLQFKFLVVAVVLAAIALWLEGCNYAIVESSPVHITWAGTALAEEAEGFIGLGSCDAAGETAVKDIQTRLEELGYLYDYEPGMFDAYTESAIYWFQGRNNLEKNGRADELTQKKLYSENAVAPEQADHPYFMRVSLDEQKVYVYRWVCGGYNLHIKTMICSTGKAGWETPKGLFHSSGHAGDRWHYFKMYNAYGQYAFNINGNILFHSVLFDEADEKTLQKNTLDALGTPVSHGCVRLTVDDAYWIYWNNKPGAPIEVAD